MKKPDVEKSESIAIHTSQEMDAINRARQWPHRVFVTQGEIMIADTRIIAGRRWMYDSTHPSRNDAREWKEHIKEDGYRVRIIKGRNGECHLYIS